MLIWADGFDHYGDPSYMLKNAYAVATNVGSALLHNDPELARTGNGSLLLSTADNNLMRLRRDFAVAGLEFGAGFGLQFTGGDIPGTASSRIGFGLVNGADFIGCVYVNPDFSVSFIAGGPASGPTPIGTSEAGALTPFWNWLEFYMFVDPVNGMIEVRANGARVLLLTGLNLGVLAATGFCIEKGNAVGSGWGTVRARFDDLVIWNSEGALNNDFFGPTTHCRTRFPASNGPLQEWTPSGATPAWQMLAQVPPDIDNDNIKSDTIGNVSNFGAQLLNTNVAYARAVQMIVLAERDAVPATGFIPGFELNGTIYPGDEITPAQDSGYFYSVREADPEQGGYWRIANLQALLFNMDHNS